MTQNHKSFPVVKEQERITPIVARPDICVVGSGPAGIGAAIAAARLGAKTLLIERYGFVGGNLTMAMVNPMFTFHDIHGRQVIRGIAGEFVQRLISGGASLGHLTDLTFDNASMTPFDPEGTKVLLFNMLEEAGVQILLHSLLVGVQTEPDENVPTQNGAEGASEGTLAGATQGTTERAGNRGGSKITTLYIENKSGRQAICPHYVIDCSADADVVARAGAPFVKGRESDGTMQPATLYFRIGNVHDAKLRSWMKTNRHLLKDSPTDDEIDSQKAIAFLGMNDRIKAAKERGELDPEIAPRILMYQLPAEGQFSVNTTRLQNVDGTDILDLTRAEILLRKQVLQIHRFLKREVVGFENSHIIDTGLQAGIRETRHITGDYTLTETDVLNGAAFEDGICCGTFAIDIHPPKGEAQIFTGSGKAVYEIPYRCLLPQGLDNLLVAGRSISATHTAFGSARVMATAMAIGEGAGTAAALAYASGCTSRAVNIKLLRSQLIKQGQYLLNENIEPLDDKSLILKRDQSSGERAGHYNPFAGKEPTS